MFDLVVYTVTFRSESGDLPNDMEKDFESFERQTEWYAKQIAEKYHIEYKIEDS